MIEIYKLENMGRGELEKIMQRGRSDLAKVTKATEKIIREVRKNGDDALVEYTKQWDDPQFSKGRIVVTKDEIARAYKKAGPQAVKMIRAQIRLSKRFHKAQKKRIMGWSEKTGDGITFGEKWTAIDEVGLYIPGGKNPFPTVQQILGVAAKTAGCRRIVSCISPKGENNEVLVAANECGIREIYRAGGAQAIAAMAYGTKTIRPVSLIAGPGNPFVTTAKRLCQERVAIDTLAGPSEAIILADGTFPQGMGMQRKAELCAADILARAEHGPDSAGVMVTDSIELASKTREGIKRQFRGLGRKEYIRASLGTYSAIIVARDMEKAAEFTNEYAPEHLEIMTKNPQETFRKIRNAGSVFLGIWNPVALGDYASGVNHILPTGGWAKMSSPAGVWTFMKRVQYSEATKKGAGRLLPIVRTIAGIEGLDAHKKSVEMRRW